MIRNSICTIIISVITIFIVHFLYEYFKKNLTTPKIKDLISKPKKEYENIYKIIKDDTKSNLEQEQLPDNISINTHIANTPNSNNINKELIKDELKNFFNDLNTTHNTDMNIDKNSETNIINKNNNQDINFNNF